MGLPEFRSQSSFLVFWRFAFGVLERFDRFLVTFFGSFLFPSSLGAESSEAVTTFVLTTLSRKDFKHGAAR